MQQKFLDFFVDEQFIRAPRYRVVADSQDYLFARFSFGKAWQGLTKTAVFQAADGSAYHLLLQEDVCRVPAEVLQPTEFFVSVFGGERLTTDRAVIEVAASGFIPGVVPPPTTPDIYSQLAAAVGTQREEAQEAARIAAEKAALAEQCAQNASANAAQVTADKKTTAACAVSAASAASEADSRAAAAAVFAAQGQKSAEDAALAAETANAAAKATAEDAAAALASAVTAEQNAATAVDQVQQLAALLPPKMRLINKVTLTESVKEIAFTTDLDGKKIALKSACYFFMGKISKAISNSSYYLCFRFNDGIVYQRFSNHSSSNNESSVFYCTWGLCEQVAPGLLVGLYPQEISAHTGSASDAISVQGLLNVHSTPRCTFYWSPDSGSVLLKKPSLLLRENANFPGTDPYFLEGTTLWVFGEDYTEEAVS